jgi:hypothetical protein
MAATCTSRFAIVALAVALFPGEADAADAVRIPLGLAWPSPDNVLVLGQSKGADSYLSGMEWAALGMYFGQGRPNWRVSVLAIDGQRVARVRERKKRDPEVAPSDAVVAPGTHTMVLFFAGIADYHRSSDRTMVHTSWNELYGGHEITFRALAGHAYQAFAQLEGKQAWYWVEDVTAKALKKTPAPPPASPAGPDVLGSWQCAEATGRVRKAGIRIQDNGEIIFLGETAQRYPVLIYGDYVLDGEKLSITEKDEARTKYNWTLRKVNGELVIDSRWSGPLRMKRK